MSATAILAAQIRTLTWPAAGPSRLTEGAARQPAPPDETWTETALIPVTPDPGLLEDLDAAPPLELWKRRALTPVVGSATKFELAVPADLAQVVPPEAGAFLAGTTTYGSVASILGAPPAPATGYTPALEDADGVVYVMDSNLWLIDARQATVEFPWGVPASMPPPFALTFFKYTGGIGGGVSDPLTVGTLRVSTIDTAAAGALAIAPANATSVAIADAGVTTEIRGPLTVIDTPTVEKPAGLSASGNVINLGNSLNSSPKRINTEWSGGAYKIDVSNLWTLNAGAVNGVIQYTGATSRYFSILCLFNIVMSDAGGGAPTVNFDLEIQKDTAGDDIFIPISALTGHAITLEQTIIFPILGAALINQNDKIQFFCHADSDLPNIIMGIAQLLISQLL